MMMMPLSAAAPFEFEFITQSSFSLSFHIASTIFGRVVVYDNGSRNRMCIFFYFEHFFSIIFSFNSHHHHHHRRRRHNHCPFFHFFFSFFSLRIIASQKKKKKRNKKFDFSPNNLSGLKTTTTNTQHSYFNQFLFVSNLISSFWTIIIIIISINSTNHLCLCLCLHHSESNFTYFVRYSFIHSNDS